MCESNPQPLGYESDTLPTGPLHPLTKKTYSLLSVNVKTCYYLPSLDFSGEQIVHVSRDVQVSREEQASIL